jgi:hypothetical protein
MDCHRFEDIQKYNDDNLTDISIRRENRANVF